jgi:multidrug efflux pump subunit AcrB
MKLKRELSLALVAGAMAIFGISVAGCGSESVSASDRGFEEVLVGLRQGAKSNATYDEVRHAKDLAPEEKAVADAFCVEIQKLVLNDEAERVLEHQTYIFRIITTAERSLSSPDKARVRDDIARLRQVLGPSYFEPRMVSRYGKACGPPAQLL